MLLTHGLSIPMGFFVPCMVLGAAVGRLYAEFILEFINPNFDVNPGIFALLGAASMITGVTRLTFTTIVIMFEITNES